MGAVASIWVVCALGCIACTGKDNSPSSTAEPPEASGAEPAAGAEQPRTERTANGDHDAGEADGGEAVPPEPELVKAPDGTVMQPCPDELPGDMSCIPGGPFIRGRDDGPDNERPQATVWVSTFLMDRNEVTYAAYKACEKAGDCNQGGPQYLDFDRPEQPINGITWYDADKYCRAHGKRLPTEAEWEKAARGTDGRLYPWGNEVATCERAIIKGESEGRGCGLEKTKGDKPETGRPWPVGSRPPNQFGLYDMAGNSWEWVSDWYTSSYEACGEACAGVDPQGPCAGEETCDGHRRKIIRGGSWYWPADHATSVYRRAHVPRNQPFHHFGFRCAASLQPGEALSAEPLATPDAAGDDTGG